MLQGHISTLRGEIPVNSPRILPLWPLPMVILMRQIFALGRRIVVNPRRIIPLWPLSEMMMIGRILSLHRHMSVSHRARRQVMVTPRRILPLWPVQVSVPVVRNIGVRRINKLMVAESWHNVRAIVGKGSPLILRSRWTASTWPLATTSNF